METIRKCSKDSPDHDFNVSVLNATFFENCIEDNESGPRLSYNIINACSSDVNNVDPTVQMLVYAKRYGDLLYVIQNGSLLTVDENFEGYEIREISLLFNTFSLLFITVHYFSL